MAAKQQKDREEPADVDQLTHPQPGLRSLRLVDHILMQPRGQTQPLYHIVPITAPVAIHQALEQRGAVHFAGAPDQAINKRCRIALQNLQWGGRSGRFPAHQQQCARMYTHVHVHVYMCMCMCITETLSKQVHALLFGLSLSV